jgi:hypothetical protein
VQFISQNPACNFCQRSFRVMQVGDSMTVSSISTAFCSSSPISGMACTNCVACLPPLLLNPPCFAGIGRVVNNRVNLTMSDGSFAVVQAGSQANTLVSTSGGHSGTPCVSTWYVAAGQ